MKRQVLTNFTIAGFSYYEGALHFSKLEIGTPLRIEWEKDNRYDENALALYYGDAKLGFVPKAVNATISKIIQSGYKIFECVVNRLDPTEHPENQVGVTLYVVAKEEGEMKG